MDKDILKIRIYLWAGLLFLTGFFLWMGIVPLGKITYITDFSKENSFIGKLTPKERIGSDFNNIIIGNPVYFSLATPRTFDKAKVTMEFSGYSANVIEMGVLVDKTVWRYDLRPVKNKIIDDLARDWNFLREDDLILLQRENKFSSISEFKNNLPSREKIALYNIDIDQEYLLADYQVAVEPTTINHALIGTYEFYTYIKNEDLKFDFVFQDVNQNKDADPIDINLYYDDRIIDSRHLDDDGVATDSQQVSLARDFGLELKNLPEGVYKLEVKANNDIVTKRIYAKQNKISFVNKINLANQDKKSFSLHTDGRHLSALTIYPDGRQNIKIGEKNLEILETYKQFETDIEASEIVLEEDGVLLASDGVLAFSREALLNSKFKKVATSLDLEKIDYILADYKIPDARREYQIATIEVDLKNAYREGGKYSFIISVPGLKIEDNNRLEIKKIKIELAGRSLVEKIKDILW